MDNPIRKAIISACRDLMIPIARFLLRYGFSYKEFEEIAKWAFVKVATDEYGLRRRITNVSRVAVMTGLSRKEVTNIRNAMRCSKQLDMDAHMSLPSRLLSIWHQDVDYLDCSGSPIDLPFEGAPKSFTALVRKCSTDVPPGAILGELARGGAIVESQNGMLQVASRRFVPLRSDVAMIYRFGQRIRDLATTIDCNLHVEPGPIRRFESTADNMRIREDSLPKLRRLTVEHGSKFLESVDEWLSASSIGEASDSDADGVRVGVGVYFFQGDSENMEYFSHEH